MSIRLTGSLARLRWYVGDTWKLTRRVTLTMVPLVVPARTCTMTPTDGSFSLAAWSSHGLAQQRCLQTASFGSRHNSVRHCFRACR